MIPVVTTSEAARMDERSPDPVDVLMERAGLAVALAAAEMGVGYGSRVSVLCGPGNNGGDGYVAARHLSRRGVAVQVEALAPPRTEAARAAAELARRSGVTASPMGEPARVDVVVDAVFGGGFRRGLPPELEPWLEIDVPVVAVDVPTGLDPDTGTVDTASFRAERTVTFEALKPGHLLGAGPDHCGQVVVAEIGLAEGEPAMMVVEGDDALRPPRPERAHKWSAGSVLVVGGAAGMVGAAVLAGRAALNFGAGAVGVASRQAASVATLAPELLTHTLDDLDEVADRYDVVVLGPGLGEDAETVDAVLGGAGRVLADADALRSVDALEGFAGDLVVTPHVGEFRRMSRGSAGPGAARDLAKRLEAVVVLKGWPTFVTGGGPPWAIVSGGPELATIGTGDVLAGMTAALWARGLTPLEAAMSAAHWHGVAGAVLAADTTVTADRLARHVGQWSGV